MATAEATSVEMQRISRLLALVLTKDMDSKQAALILTRAGYSQAETGSLLGLTSNAVKHKLRRIRKAQSKRSRSGGEEEGNDA